MKIKWTHNAICELLETCDYIAESSPETSLKFFEDIYNSTARLEIFPKIGKQAVGDSRLLTTKHKSRILYIIKDDTIIILEFIPSKKKITRLKQP